MIARAIADGVALLRDGLSKVLDRVLAGARPVPDEDFYVYSIDVTLPNDLTTIVPGDARILTDGPFFAHAVTCSERYVGLVPGDLTFAGGVAIPADVLIGTNSHLSRERQNNAFGHMVRYLDLADGRHLMQTLLPAETVSGTGERPLWFPRPWLLPGGGRIGIDVQNRVTFLGTGITAASLVKTVRYSFLGIQRYS